ncbi:MAG: SDR family oxidoreductase [Candidatus Dormibacteria bacterium]
MTRTLALELGHFNITGAVAPGLVDTAMARAVSERLNLSREEFHRRPRERIPLGRLGGREDIYSVITFLGSEDSAYVSGRILDVKGGPS